MPELPEVETTKRGLTPSLLGREMVAVEVRRRDLRWPIPDEFEEIVTGARVSVMQRIGKYLVFELDNGWSILAHLGMSGTFRIEPLMPEILRKHDHLCIELESGEVMIFHDPRRFGFILLSESGRVAEHPRLAEMGPDPFDKECFHAQYFAQKLKARKAPIKPVLLDQKLVAGIGNIYASEALFEAGIAPHRPANSLKTKEIAALIEAIRKVLADAIASGGSTLRDFAGSGGESGYFQHQFKVYDRSEQPCVECKEPLMVEVMAGRSSFYCQNCQT